MQTYTANEAKTHFGEMLDAAQRAPVQVTRHKRVVGVVVSAEDYAAMRVFYKNRLHHAMNDSAEKAAQAGLTEDSLERLLEDES